MGIRTNSILLSLMGNAMVIYMVAPFLMSDPHSLSPRQSQLSITITQATSSTETSQPLQQPTDTTATAAKKVPLEIAKAIEAKQTPKPEKIAHRAIPQPIPQPVVTKAPVQITKKPPHKAQAPAKPLKPPQVASSRPAILEIESSYTSDLLKAIERHRRYPLRARRRGDEGEVLVNFTIMEDGEITSIQIASSSSSSSLDQAASRALEKLKQFRPIPHQLQRASWDFRIPVRFALN
ncbi:hypothetical protein MNBD_GAMMA26-452 [hydrothermal vent metagenome]|uniref:TonB C-terminal domain-containing protein n=1 Tax=hydrothermal vent metagenome TaxID=652676 RepID=A0A3B1ALA3_9ZZZZ